MIGSWHHYGAYISVILAFWVATACAGDAVDYSRDVLPIFQKHCLSCHGPTKQKGGLRLDRKAEALKGGTIHGPDIVPGKSDESPLVRFAAGLEDDLVMPPNEKNQRVLTDAEIKILRAWVDAGAALARNYRRDDRRPAGTLGLSTAARAGRAERRERRQSDRRIHQSSSETIITQSRSPRRPARPDPTPYVGPPRLAAESRRCRSVHE